MATYKILKNIQLTRFIHVTVLLCFLSPGLAGQNGKKNKKTVKADILCQKAIVLGDSAKYDSAVILLTEASLIYKKKKNTEKYIDCRNQILIQQRKIKFKDELLESAKENVIYSDKMLGNKHYLTGTTYSLLGNIYSDINKIDSALFYFKKAKGIWEPEAGKNKMLISGADLDIGHLLNEKGEFKSSSYHLHSALKTRIDSLGKNHIDIAPIYNTLGRLHTKKGDNDSSIYYFDKMLKIRKKHYGAYHTKVADAYINVGSIYKAKGEYSKALELYQKSVDIREKSNNPVHPYLALSYNNIGVVHSALGDYKKAKDYHEKALKIRSELFGENHIELAASYTNLGINCMYLGKGGSAIKYMQSALKIVVEIFGTDNPNSANTYNNMGAAYVYGLGDYDKALNYFIKALELRLKINTNNPMLAGSYNNIGVVYRNRGDYELALSYFKSELKILLDHFGQEHVSVAKAYNNMGLTYMYIDELDQAKQYFNKALDIRVKIFGENNIELTGSYLNIGMVYSKLKQPGQEKINYEKGLEICLKSFDENNINVAKFYSSLGTNATDRKDYTNAISLFKKALIIEEKSYPENHPDIAKSLSYLGYVNFLMGNYDLSGSYYLTSLDANYIGTLSDDLDYFLILDEIQHLETLSKLSDLYVKKYRTSNNNKSLKEAVNYYKKASDMLSYLVSDYYIEASKLNLLKDASVIIEKALVSSEILYQNQKKKENIELAFSFSEQNKSSVLYGSIIKSKIETENTSDSLWVTQQNLSGKIDYLKTEFLEKENDSIDLQSKNQLDAELSKAIIDYQIVTEKIRSKELNKQFVVSRKQELINSIQYKLNSSELMLEYFISDSAVYCFVIGKHILELKKVNITPKFKDILLEYIKDIKKHRFGKFQDNSNYLYNKLIKPVEKYFADKSKLIIIPDGHLLYLPFGSLISQKNNTNKDIDFSKLNYLIKDYEIVYQYSANLWLENIETGKINKQAKGFLGIAPFSTNEILSEIDSNNISFLDKSLPESVLRSVINSENQYKPLPFSGKEVANISELFALENKRTKSLIKKDASEKNLKVFAKDYKYIHIATHGIINNVHPELSGLAFINKNTENVLSAENKKDWKYEQDTDGILYAKEIFDLDLNADIVVLSACETGIGKLEKGEGIISITRGFLYNKVPNIIFSLWKINDKNTCALMTDFYGLVLQGKSYAAALRQAKLNMINNKETAYPGNWAAFSLIGE